MVNNQTTLFEQSLSHTRDPITSFVAADKLVKSGELSRQERQVWNSIIWFLAESPKGNFTARELADWCPGDHYFTIQRRLSGLRNHDKIERTGEKRNGCMVWKIIEREQKEVCRGRVVSPPSHHPGSLIMKGD